MTTTTTLLRILLADLHESKHNPRSVFDPIEMQELAASLTASGQLTPLLVRPHPKGGYEIGAGACRRRAAEIAGLTHLDAMVRELDDATFVELVNTENRQRHNLNAMDEARGFVDWMKTAGLKIPDIAARIGLSEKYVYDRVKLLQLIPPLQKLLTEGAITPGHGILLARLSSADQERALGSAKSGNGRIGGVFIDDHGGDGFELDDVRKPVSVRELQHWIEDNVRFVPAAVDLPNLFPETEKQLAVAQEEELKVVKITRDWRVPDEAKDPKERTYGEASWKRADGQSETARHSGKAVPGKTCEHAVMGIVVAGPGRGEAFKVCIEKKKCDVHWKAERAESEKRAKANGTGTARESHERERQRYEERRKAEDAERARWKKAMPDLLAAVVEKLAVAPAGMESPIAKALLRRYQHSKGGFTPKGKSAEDVVRLLAFHEIAIDSLNEWRAPTNAPRELKLLGIDAQAIVDRVAPKDPPVQPSAKSADKPKPKKLAGDVRRARKKVKK